METFVVLTQLQGPDNNPEALKKYALLLSGNPDGTPTHRRDAIAPGKRHHVQDIVKVPSHYFQVWDFRH